MSKTFKKGDKVRALDSSAYAFTKGKLYVVRQDYPGIHGDSVKIAEDDEGSTTNGWHEDFFEPEVSRGCLVAVRGGAPSWHTPVFYEHRSNANAQAKQLAEKYVGTEFAVYEQVTSFVADKPTAREV